ncbi:XkdF-like putative serine protease domain-containing protein [Methanobrevibacter olleyae]|uniref:Phage-related protein n=1 Tax=Methanobrevibacter olleyae TaxID=294671 RepID=A0A126R2L9_METOL|nr:XkdF-like putative serine protease domain-containing protein [Methanobrevibacter olleyae]AMK16317.1 phage-related protein [Methanobrevibacter olleyae]
MSVIPEKQEAIYVRGVVIAAGMKDDQGDTAPDKEGIKKIFTNYLEHQTDVQHSYIKSFNIHQLENTITTTETQINGQTVPSGSWVASHMVLNPSIKAMISEGKLNAYSLGAIGDKGLNENQDFLNKSLMYKNLKDYDELNPFFISFVKKPSNGFLWEVLDYNQFLNKSSLLVDDIAGDIMTEDNKLDDEKISISSLEKIQKLFRLNKESDPTDSDDNKEEVDDVELNKEEPVADDDISNKELLETLPSLVAEAVITALSEFANKEDNAKQEEGLQKEATPEDKEAGEVDDKELEKGSKNHGKQFKLKKSSQKIDEMKQEHHVKPNKTFLDSETRDEFGRNKKYL